jgi:hypothetical protein
MAFYVLCSFLVSWLATDQLTHYLRQGETWDGGPPARLPLLLLEYTYPSVSTVSDGGENGERFTQTPRLEFSDEGAVAVTSFQNRVIDASVEKVSNGESFRDLFIWFTGRPPVICIVVN